MQHKFTFKNHLKRVALTLFALMVTCATAWAASGNWSSYKASSFSSANGTTINITSPAELALLAYNVTTLGEGYSGYTINLTTDLNMSAHYWDTPIGLYDETHDNTFMGTFDGGNHTISGIYTSNSTSDYQGLFGFVGRSFSYDDPNVPSQSGTVRNLTLANSTITGKENVGGIAAYLWNGTISNCHVLPSVTIQAGSSNSKYHGGIVGQINPGQISQSNSNYNPATVQNCTCGASITSGSYSGCSDYGGIVGSYNRNTSTLTGCFYNGTSISANSNKGAIIGSCTTTSGISNCYYYYPSTINGIGSGGNVNSVKQVYQLTLATTDLTISSSPTYTFNGTNYYASATVTNTSNTHIIKSLGTTSGTISNITYSNNRHSATFNLGSGDVTLTVTLQALSGNTSDGLTWSLSGTNYTTLTISGNGAMQNYGHTTVDDLWRTDAPWGYNITSVTIGNGVTKIGDYAFVGCQNLGTVNLGSGITSIGNYAFDHCDPMTQITLPANVTSLGNYVFSQCGNLQRVNFMHDGAITLGNNGIFTNCTNLQYLVFPTPAGALANTTGNWSGFTDKLRASLGNQIFKVTNEGGTNAYDIATADDLNNLSTAVNGGANGSGYTFRQTANITVSNFTPIGSTETNYFGGTYDGGNKTLNVTINDTGNQGTALFRNIQGATIKNLILTGSVTGTIHAAALVGFSRPGGTNTIDCCKVAANVTVNTATNNNYHCGGVVGHALTSTLNISKTLYCGTITNSGNYVGGFQGWSDGSTVTISNCLFVGTYTGTTTGTALFHPIALRNTNSAATAVASNTYYDKIPTVTNSNFIAADGKKTTAVTTAPSNLGSVVATLSYMTVYQNGILYNGNYYAAPVLPTGGTNIYLINNAAQWTAFCDMLYDNATYNRFKGKTVKLGANITVTRMAGGSNHDFCGSFDGQNYTLTFNYGSSTAYANEAYIAPFSYVSNVDGVAANINNLKVAGTIYTSAQFAAGLVGGDWGDVNIQNCRVSTVINSSIEGDGTHGGIVGVNRSGTLTITGCAFDGQLLGSSTNACGGIVGFRTNSATTNIYYTLFAPTNLTIGTDNSATFIRNATNSCKDGCYYTQEFNDGTNNTTNQGQKAYAFTTQPSNIGTLVQNYGMVEAYTNGLKFNNNYYVNLGSDFTINEDGTEYTIHNATGWDLFCGLIESGETFSGKTVKLDADISVSRMAGSNNDNNVHVFSGAFNGQNHTLTFTCTAASSNYVAPFGYVKGGNNANSAITISNLNVLTTITAADYRHVAGLIALQDGHVNVTDCYANVTLSATKGTNNPSDLYPAGLVSQVSSSDNGTLTISGCTVTGTIATDGKYAAGMVGVVQGSANITNSVSSVTINSSTDGDGTHGGLVSVLSTNSSTTITGCLFNGKLLSVGTTATTIRCGGFVGWRSGSLTISNSLYAPNVVEGETWINDSESATFVRNPGTGTNAATITNCYYVTPLGAEQGKQQRSITAGSNVTINAIALVGTSTATYNISGITAYTHGLACGENLYFGYQDQVNLSLSHSEAPTGYTFTGYTANAGALDGTTLTMPNEDVTISATMTANTYTVQFDGNGSTNGSMSDQTFTYDEAQNLTANAFTRTGYTFAGWNTQANGSGNSYTNGQSVINLTDQGTVTLYAQWTPNSYTVQFNGNGNTGGSMSDQTFTYDVAQNLTANAFTRTGYTFASWNTVANGSGTSYSDGEEVSNLTDQDTVTLYAQWTANTYYVHFNGNGNTGGSMSDQSFTYDEAQNLNANAFTRTSYAFTDWNTQANGSGTSYSDGEEVINLTDQGTVTLYAQWESMAVSYLDEDGVEQQCTDYTLLTGTITNTGFAAGWYVAEDTVTFNSTININGDAHLILKDGAVVNVGTEESPIDSKGISDYGHPLNIYAQSTGADKGQLHVYSSQYGINALSSASVTINGGEVTASGALYGIYAYSGASVTINGGQLTATGNGNSGIYATSGSSVTINGGEVTTSGTAFGISASGSVSVTINGGQLTATGNGSSGIYATSGSSVTINGGQVSATGVSHGIYASQASVNINDGQVTATGSDGIYFSQNMMTISGGQVSAIGNGNYSFGIYVTQASVEINGGQVTATGNGDYSYGIYASGSCSVTIGGGQVTANSTGNNGSNGIGAAGGNVYLGWTNPTDFILASSYIIDSHGGSIIATKAFIDDDGNTYQSGPLNEYFEAIAGKKLYPYVEGSVHYIDENGQRQMRLAGEYTILTGNETTLGTAGQETWYVAQGNLDYFSTINLDGETHIILADGAVMNVTTTSNYGINGTNGNCSLFVYGQSGQSGQLNVTSNWFAIIVQGDITIAGGIVTATSMSTSDIAIYAVAGDITITGCEVEATGGNGIFADNSTNNSGGNVTIQNATVTATTTSTGYTGAIRSSNGDITINNSNVTATGTGKYGIYAENSGNILLNGGKITASGSNYGIFCYNGIIIESGQVEITGGSFGILANNITLGWTNPTDYIYANSYIDMQGDPITLANAFIDEDGNTYDSGTIAQVDGAYPIDGKTLYSYIMGSVPYLDMNGERQFCTEECTPLANSMTDLGTADHETWYVANDTINFTNTISVKGDVHIILKDRAVVNFGTENNPINNNVISSVGHSLSIYGQSTGENNGQLNIYSRYFCIYITDGDFNCSSARVTASCISTSYGIFVASTNNSSLGHINLKDATINASGSSGIKIDGVTMAINGGQVTANGNDYGIYACNSSSITISDGIMTATGNYYDGIYVDNSDMTISGGQVTATGARGINAISGGTVTIGGGQVTANATTYHGICANNGTVTINGGHVTANGNKGINASNSNGSVNINGGQVTANGTTYGIFAYFAGTVNINGGQVTANGNTYGIYAEQGGSCVTLSWTNATDSIFANSYGIGYANSISIAEGKAFIDGNGNTYYNGTLNSEQLAAMAGQTLTPGEATVTYLDMNGELQTCTEFTPLTGTITNTGLANGWYVAEGNVTFNSTIAVNGDAHLILKDGAVVNVGTESSPMGYYYGINASEHSLSIYGQSTGENKGQLNVYTDNISIYASNASVNLNGGQVTASGALYGINASSGGAVTINGGQVTATGTSNSGIYAYSNTGSVTINGGQVTANGNNGIHANYGSTVTISGGQVTANGTSTGIDAYRGSTVTINGGEVTANGSSFGIYAFNGSITLGWTNLTDFIHASRYSISETGSISIAEGKVFIDDDGNSYESGPLSYEQFAALANQTLHPVGEDAVTYLDMNGQRRYCQAYTVLTGSETEPLTTGWYVADGTINFTSTILVNGDIHIILKDNAVMNVGTEDSPVQTGIEGIIQHLSNINIYGQSTGENNGQLNIYAMYVDIRASGGDFNCSSARVTTSSATGTSVFATSSSGTGGNITLKDATVNVSGPIGLQANGNLTINGGEVNATATANYGIGIYAQGGSVTINGGEVTATATASNGYGIQAENGSVNINGGQVTASGTQYGIYAYNGNITLGWNNATDFILANSYSASGTVSIAEGKTFIAENAIYNGTIAQVSGTYPIDGKTLYPAVAIALDEGLTAVSGIIAYGGNLYAKVGETVTINTDGASIPAGYTFTVIPEVPVTDNGNGNYSFTVPTVDVSVSSTNFTSTGEAVAVSYIDANGSLQEHLAIALDGTMTTLGSEGEETWYFVGTDIYTMNAITLANGGAVHLILVDGKTMNINPDFYNSDSYSIGGASDLTIYGQAQGTGTLSTANTIEAINITINGGTVNAKTFDENSSYPIFFVFPPAIRSNGNFVINDGTLYTEGSYGILVAPPNGTTPIEGVTYSVTINGGKVTAIGHSVSSGFGEPEQYHGIAAMGSITLGWKNNSDYIYTNTYASSGTLSIAEGKAFIDEDGNTYSGIIEQVDDAYSIDGKTLYPWSENVITYLDENGQQRYCAAYTTLTGSENSLGTANQETWYVADGNVGFDHQISTVGDVHLILKDNATMNVGTESSRIDPFGISPAQSLSIYAQSTGESKGQLNVYGTAAGIHSPYGSVTINGGEVTATGNTSGIDGNVTIINGGQVTAISPYNDCIGGTTVTINGGQVTAYGEGSGIHTVGGNVNINGGQVTANIEFAGIVAHHGDVNISGGQVTASGEDGGIIASYGNINLGWTHTTDFIQANKYALLGDGNHTLTLINTFVDEDSTFYEMGVIEQEDGAYPIDGKKLLPTGIPYLDENGDQQFCMDFIILDGTETTLGNENEENWYVVNSDVSYTDLWIYGDIHLILVDDKMMTLYHESGVGALLGPTADLTIYGQTQGTGTLVSPGMIGANNITINGGKVDVDNNDNLPAIWSNGDMVINNGIVYAIGEGGGIFATSMGAKSDDMTTHNITINGGQVSACGTSSELDNMGIVAKGIITLGWRNADDYIYCSRYYADSILRIAEGKAFIDYYGNIYSGIIDTVSGGHYPIGEWNSLRPYVISTFTKEIVARTGNNTGNNKGWYLIASPIGNVAPANVGNMLSNDFDLYRFNQSAELEWENWKAEGEHNHFDLELGRGYLYSNSQDVLLTFTGMPYSGDGTITLSKTDNAQFAGWNLVGNPFAEIAYLPVDREHYTLNDDGSEVVVAMGNSVEAMEGIFIIAEVDDEMLTFSTTNPGLPDGKGSLSINVTKTANHRDGNGLIDRAILRFGEGGLLPKFQLNPNSTKVYIPQDGEDYAVVRSEGMGEVPVNFKAEENGTYNLTFSSTEVTFNYLHLIDNMTGADVDLLAATSTGSEASYTFTARTTDYESRFKLVFVCGDANDDNDGDNETFAFYFNGNWIIANDGDATLQVIDLNGRILSSERINGSVSKSIHAVPGVYMLRLINGDEVRTQKIVVR